MSVSLSDKELDRLAGKGSAFGDSSKLYCPLLSAAIAGRDEDAMRLIMKKALHEKISARVIDEIILQSHLFLGFPAMIEASRLFAEYSPVRRRGYHLPEPYSEKECQSWNKNGLDKIKRIYGPAFERLTSYISSFSPQILTWMINDGYGQVLSRPGVSFHLRELSVVTTLTVTSYQNQLKAHIRGALNFGIDPAQVATAIGNCKYFCSRQKIKTALRILDRTRVSDA